jgi:hypothetical protein
VQRRAIEINFFFFLDIVPLPPVHPRLAVERFPSEQRPLVWTSSELRTLRPTPRQFTDKTEPFPRCDNTSYDSIAGPTRTKSSHPPLIGLPAQQAALPHVTTAHCSGIWRCIAHGNFGSVASIPLIIFTANQAAVASVHVWPIPPALVSVLAWAPSSAVARYFLLHNHPTSARSQCVLHL